MEEYSKCGIKHFDPTADGGNAAANWYRWKVAANWYVSALNLNDRRKIAKLMTLGGPHVQMALESNSTDEEYKLLTDQSLDEPEEGLLGKAFNILEKSFAGAANPLAQMQVLQNTKQNKGENIRHYHKILTMLAENCGFEGEEKVRIIKQQLLLGTNSSTLKIKVVTDKLHDKSLPEILEIAYNIEQAEGFANKGSETVSAVKIEKQERQNGKDCDGCGFNGHGAMDNVCPAKNSDCRICGEIGHYARMCRRNFSRRSHFSGSQRGSVRFRDGERYNSQRRYGENSFGSYQRGRENYRDRDRQNYRSGSPRYRSGSPYPTNNSSRSRYKENYDGSRRNDDESSSKKLKSMEKVLQKVVQTMDSMQNALSQGKRVKSEMESDERHHRKKQMVRAINGAAEVRENETESSENDSPTETVNFVEPKDKMEKVLIGKVEVAMMLDSGCQRNLIPKAMFDVMKNKGLKILKTKLGSDVKFKAYGASKFLDVIMQFQAELYFNGIVSTPWFYVVDAGDLNLLGKISSIRHKAMSIGISAEETRKDNLFFNKIKGERIRVNVKDDAKPIIQHKRAIPVHYQEEIKKILKDLEHRDIIEAVNTPTEWISNMVIAQKKDGTLRICIDMRDVNKAIEREVHPMPTFEEIATMLHGAVKFSSMDVKDAFLQLELDEEARKLTTFYTPNGLYRYKRMLFGLSTAPEAFQKKMEGILSGLSGCVNYIDDILVFGKTEKQHDENLQRVLERLKKFNVLLKDEKSSFNQTEVIFLGHKFTRNGYEMLLDKLAAVKQLRAPTRKDELSAFLGLASYLSRFIYDFATISKPLRILLHDKKLKTKSHVLTWADEHESAFQAIKSEILKNIKLHSFSVDKNLETILIVDASPVALGGVLIQRENEPTERGEEPDKIILFISKTLTDVETRYCHTEKEALAIIWAIERLQFFLRGTTFTVITDHRALEVLYNKNRKTCPRIERWVLRVQEYDFLVMFAPGKDNLADPFSRLIAAEYDNGKNDETVEDDVVNYVSEVNMALIAALSIEEIQISMINDKFGNEIIDAIKSGKWPKHLKSWEGESGVFSEEKNLLLYDEKIYIPETLRKDLLKLAHEGHLGRNKSLSRLRERVWWPRMSTELMNEIKNCSMCLLTSDRPRKIPSKMRTLPDEPWQCVAADFKDSEGAGKKILVIIDYYSRYMVLKIQNSTTFEETAKSLLETFASFGVCKTFTSDNGPPFSSKEFERFSKEQGFIHHTSIPQHAQSNGLAESAMKAIGKSQKISKEKGTCWETDLLYKYLPCYLDAAQSTTGKSPYELMFGRKMATKIPEIRKEINLDHEEIRRKDSEMKKKMKEKSDKFRGAKDSLIEKGDWVIVFNKDKRKYDTNYGRNVYRIIKKCRGDCTLELVKDPTQVIRRSIEQLKKIEKCSLSDDDDEAHEDVDDEKTDKREVNTGENDDLQDKDVEAKDNETHVRKSGRERKANSRYQDFVANVLEISDFQQLWDEVGKN